MLVGPVTEDDIVDFGFSGKDHIVASDTFSCFYVCASLDSILCLNSKPCSRRGASFALVYFHNSQSRDHLLPG